MKPLSKRTMEFLRSSIGLDYEDESRDSEIRNYAPMNMTYKLFELFGVDTEDDSIPLLINCIESIWGVDIAGAICDKCGDALPRDEQDQERCVKCRTTIYFNRLPPDMPNNRF